MVFVLCFYATIVLRIILKIDYMIILFAFIFGASLGSFANLVADRLRVKTIWTGRSECLTCSHKLSWKELFPIFSYIYQKGKCKFCKAKLSPTYLWSEVVSGLSICLLVYILPTYTAIFYEQVVLFFTWSLILVLSLIIIIYDLRHTIVPMQISSILVIMGIVFTIYRQIYFGFNIYDSLSGVMISLPFAIMFFISKGKWVGFGDVLLYLAFGSILGLPLGVTTFFYSVWLGAFVSVVLMLIHRKDFNLKTEIPFTPFIIIASLFAAYTNSDLLNLHEFMR